VARIRKKSNRGGTSTRNKRNSEGKEKANAVMKTKQETVQNKKDEPTLTRGNVNKEKNKLIASSPGQSDNKDSKSKMKVSKGKTSKKNVMVTLMIAYAIVMGVLGIWAFNNFFLFYFTEASPVMGVNTESSRVAKTPEIPKKDMETAAAAAGQIGEGLETVTVHQVGPTIHFFVTVGAGVDIETGRALGNKAIVAFADALAQPEMFGTYEAQIIVTKKDLPQLDDSVILRAVGDEGAEQPFPQYGVSNKHTDGINKGISWSHNGV
jgi:hypothetical protein